MTESEAYILRYLDSKSNALSFYVSRILEVNLPMSEYFFCIETILDHVNNARKIICDLGLDHVPINKFFNELLMLHSKNIPEVRHLLQEYNYQQLFYEELNSCIKEINSGIVPLNQETIEFSLKNHLLSDKDQKTIFEFYLRSFLIRERPISFEAFVASFIDYFKHLMAMYVPNPIIIVIPEEKYERLQNKTYQNRMLICREELIQMYILGSYRAFISALQSLKHIEQYSDIVLRKKSDTRTIKLIKEEILLKHLSSYSIDNCERIFSDIEAELFSIEELLKIFEKLGITFKNSQNPYVEQIEKLKQTLSNNQRVFEGEEVPIEEIFDYIIIQHPELLTTYPQLNAEFEIGYGDLVFRKDDFKRGD